MTTVHRLDGTTYRVDDATIGPGCGTSATREAIAARGAARGLTKCKVDSGG
ncbi:MAG: hypothetical protein ACLQU1_38330 [Bryobacteraceae bacterium]